MKKAENDIDVEKLLAESLIKAGLINEKQLWSVDKQQQISSKSLETILVEQGWVKPQTITYFKENLKDSFEQQTAKELNNVTINLSAKRVFRILLTIICFLTSVSLIGQLSQRYLPDFFLRDGFARIFNLDGEQNIPAVYSALALLSCSIILSFITYIKKNRHDSYTPYWRGLSIVFAFLSFDELASLHESIMYPVRAALKTDGFLYFAWVIPGSIGVLIFLLVFLKFITNLTTKTRNIFLIAGTTYIAGAIGCEMVGGYIVSVYTRQSIFYVFEFTLEEFLEQLGVAIFIYGLLSYIGFYAKDAFLKIKIPHKNRIDVISI
ncbi:hypothetical protein NIES4071_65800 [Calothrix sp. NIES-4071]|nr:hypothetical protein NIES4071_65800 [Calothrix sp. NIES-4071]BAZ60884.1 hypothetical protein NIES4105_65760 [Calothrix sp. NIES-4105]